MTTETELKTLIRKEKGSAAARRDRVGGRIPINVYGHGEANRELTIDERELTLAVNSSSQVFVLKIGRNKEHCLMKEVQYDALGQSMLHVDFTRVSMTDEVQVEVALEFTGHAQGVGEGGTLAIHHPALWVKCLANAIPGSLEVDVTELSMGHAVHAGEIALPPGVTLDTDNMRAGDPIVGVIAPRGIQEEEAPEGEVLEGEPAEGEPGEEGADGQPASDTKGEDEK